MDKKEKENRLAEYIEYYELMDKIREISLDALGDVLSVSDVMSVLDRVKTELMQQEVIVIMEDSQKQSETEQSEVDDELGVEDEEPVILPQVDIKTGMPFINPEELVEEARRGILNN